MPSSSLGPMRQPAGEDLDVNRIWGSCSQRQSQVPRALRHTCCGLSALQYRDGDRARRAAVSISSLQGGRQAMPTRSTCLFHLLVPGGRWQTLMCRPVPAASAASSVFHARRLPLEPPLSAVISRRLAPG